MFCDRAGHLDEFCFRHKRIEKRHLDYARNSYRNGDRTPRKHGFPIVGSYTHFEPRHLDSPHFPRRGSHSTGSKGEVQKTMKTSSSRMVKCRIPKIYLTNTNTETSTSSHLM
jgi:hypothetical protein